jgi:hypothetical protein
VPLSRIAPGHLRYVFVPALVVYVLALVPFVVLDTSGDIVALELAGSEAAASEIVNGWSAAQTIDAAYLQGVDAVHPLAYGPLLMVGAVWAGRQSKRRAARWAPAVAWIAFAAVVFDTLENIGMIAMIRGNLDDPIPRITAVLATAKFAAIVTAIVFGIAGLIVRFYARREAV